jgi:glycosyltransferase involved in cell wall biosynthesis
LRERACRWYPPNVRILIVTPRFPYPLVAGANFRNLRIIETARMEHEVDLLSFVDGPTAVADFEHVERMCGEVHLVAVRPRRTVTRLADMIRSPLPDLALRLWDPANASVITDMHARRRYDIIQFEGLEVSRFAEGIRDARIIMDSHNAEWVLQQRAFEVDRSQAGRAHRALYSRVQTARLRRYEAHWCARAAVTLSVSEADRAALQEIAPGATIRVMPNTIDPGPEPSRRDQAGPPSVLFSGTLDFRPNADAAAWLIDSVLPAMRRRVQGLRCYVVGRRPDPRLRHTSLLDPNTVVTGEVPSVDPYWSRAWAYVLPMRVGGGVRFKALEAMAHGVPLVSTRMGMDGIDAEPGVHYVPAETPEEFAVAVGALSDDAAYRERISRAARQLVCERYDWRVVAPLLLGVYRSLA